MCYVSTSAMRLKGKLENHFVFSWKNEFIWDKILVWLSPGRTRASHQEINRFRGWKGEVVTELHGMDGFSGMFLLTLILEQR